MDRIKLNIQRFAVDGSIVIGTVIDDSGIDYGLNSIEKKLENYGKKTVVKATPYGDLDTIEKFEQRLDEMVARYDDINKENVELKSTVKEISDLQQKARVEGVDMQTDGYQKQYDLLLKKNNLTREDYALTVKTIQKNNEMLEQQRKEYEFLREAMQSKYGESQDLSYIPSSIKDATKIADPTPKGDDPVKKASKLKDIFAQITSVGKGLLSTVGSIVGEVLKIGGAIAGVVIGAGVISTIFSAIGKAIINILKDNQELVASIKYVIFIIKTAINNIAEVLAPYVTKFLNWVIKALYFIIRLIASIFKIFFGINILANTSVEDFKKAQEATGGIADNLSSGADSAKDIRKQLAGFDEMNVLGDNVKPSSGFGGIGGGFGDFDISKVSDALNELENAFKKIDEKFEKIEKKGKNIKATTLGGIWTITEALGPGGLLSTLGGVPTAVIVNWEKIKGLVINAGKWSTQTILEITGKIQTKIFELVTRITIKIVETWGKIKGFIAGIPGHISNIVSSIGATFSFLWESIKFGAQKAWEGITLAFSKVGDFFSKIISKIVGFFKEMGTKVGDAIGKAFKVAINGVLKAVETILNAPIRAINGLIGAINKLPGVKFSKLSTFSLPRLAKGGIINQPGRGVMVGSAIAGESGREGVIPLTDSQQMALLGETIGKYITINANITNTMNGRVISRELQKIQNTNDFAYNR